MLDVIFFNKFFMYYMFVFFFTICIEYLTSSERTMSIILYIIIWCYHLLRQKCTKCIKIVLKYLLEYIFFILQQCRPSSETQKHCVIVPLCVYNNVVS